MVSRVEVLKHVLVKVLGQTDSSPIARAISGNNIGSMSELVAMSKDDLYALTYEDDKGKFHSLVHGDYGKLLSLKAYHIFNQREGTPISGENWLNITETMFDEFCIGEDIATVIDQTTGNILPDPQGNTPSPQHVSTVSTQSSLDNFKRGIKRDPSLFSTYKDEKQWDKYQRATLAQAHVQGVDEVLDSGYKPKSLKAKQLFTEKQKYMYAVFEKTLLTDQGKAYVREHEQDFNAQAVYRKISTYALTSTRASLDQSQILSYITSVKAGDGTWRGTLHSFILHW